ncbi:MAG: hypothetical protein ACRCWD_05770 [Culicoidibacterales bacterium]
MKLSKQELMLLTLVGTLLVGVVYYQFIFSPQLAHNQELQNKYMELNEQVRAAEEAVTTIAAKETQRNLLFLGVEAEMNDYYDTLTQEKIILDLNKMLSDHKLTGKIDFSPVSVMGVANLSATTQALLESTINQQIATYRGDEPVVETNPEQGETPAAEGEAEAPEVESVPQAATTATVEQQQINLALQGKYEDVQKFIKTVETYSQRMIITSSEMNALAEGNVSAVLTLELYAIPGMQEQAEAWGLTGSYGKDTPFSNLGTAYTQSLITADENQRDFIGVVKSSYSDLASFMLGKAGDTEKKSYLVTEQTGIIATTMRLSEKDGQYSYAYTVDSESYPTQGKQEAFVPNSNYIIVDLTSEPLVDSRDTTKLELKIENKTDKKVVVFIRNDDAKAPRIEVKGGDESIVVVKQ